MTTITMAETKHWYPTLGLAADCAANGAVIGGMTSLYLAVTTSDGLVVDDYYTRGKAINMDLAREGRG